VHSFFPRERYMNSKNFSVQEIEVFEQEVVRLRALLATMNVSLARSAVNYSNLCWLSKNLENNNLSHSKLRATLSLVRQLMNKKHFFLHEKAGIG